LTQIVAEQTLDTEALKAVVAKEVSTTARREAVFEQVHPDGFRRIRRGWR